MLFPIPFILMGFMLTVKTSNPKGIIPTKEDQANLLRSVEEVFRTTKLIVNDEGGATDSAVIGDVARIVQRSIEYLSLVQRLALTKLSCHKTEGIAFKKEAKLKIQDLIVEGQYALEECIAKTARNIYNNSKVVTKITDDAMNQGELVLNTLNQCSQKTALQQISCYKNVMTANVFPLKLSLIHALNMHKSGHLEAISIRKNAHDCVDGVLYRYKDKVEGILKDTLQPR